MQPLGILLLSPRAPQLQNVLTCLVAQSCLTLQLHGLLWTDSPGKNTGVEGYGVNHMMEGKTESLELEKYRVLAALWGQ